MTGLALALSLMLSQAPASADDTAKARAAFQWAQKLYKEARYASAIEKFEEAYRLKPHPSILFNIGRCYEQLNEIPRALRSYRDYLKAMPDAKDKEQVTNAILNLERRLKDEGVQQLIVYTDPAGAMVTIDDRNFGSSPAAVELRPGNHLVKISMEGFQPVQRNFVMSAEKSVELSFALKPVEKKPEPVAEPKKEEPKKEEPKDVPKKEEPKKVTDTQVQPKEGLAATAAPQKSNRMPFFIGGGAAGGVAVVGLVTGAILGGMSSGATEEMRSTVHTQTEVQQLHDRAQGNATGANVMYGVAGGAAVTAVVLFIVGAAGK
jgi:PEGA domain